MKRRLAIIAFAVTASVLASGSGGIGQSAPESPEQVSFPTQGGGLIYAEILCVTLLPPLLAWQGGRDAQGQEVGVKPEVVLVGTVHSPTPNFREKTLVGIPNRVKPDLILLELDHSFFDGSFTPPEKCRNISLESKAATAYAAVEKKQYYACKGLGRIIELTPALKEMAPFWALADEFWVRRNHGMVGNIVKYTKALRPRRAVTLSGYEHRHHLRRQLAERAPAEGFVVREYRDD